MMKPSLSSLPRRAPALGLAFAALWLSAGPAQAGEDTLAAGKALFGARACSACHSLEAGRNLNGPSLAGVVGRPVGSVEGYRYSSGLAEAKGAWDKARLDAWLADPRAMVPGTRMAVKVPSPQERAKIIAYLAAATGR